MSMKVEVDAVDAEMISLLRRVTGVYQVLNWDSSMAKDVTIKVEIKFPPGSTVPEAAIEAVNECVGKCVRAFHTPTG